MWDMRTVAQHPVFCSGSFLSQFRLLLLWPKILRLCGMIDMFISSTMMFAVVLIHVVNRKHAYSKRYLHMRAHTHICIYERIYPSCKTCNSLVTCCMSDNWIFKSRYLLSHPTLLISILVPLQATFEGLLVQKGAEDRKSALSLLIGVLHR